MPAGGSANMTYLQVDFCCMLLIGIDTLTVNLSTGLTGDSCFIDSELEYQTN